MNVDRSDDGDRERAGVAAPASFSDASTASATCTVFAPELFVTVSVSAGLPLVRAYRSSRDPLGLDGPEVTERDGSRLATRRRAPVVPARRPAPVKLAGWPCAPDGTGVISRLAHADDEVADRIRPIRARRSSTPAPSRRRGQLARRQCQVVGLQHAD
jgi:hypothetical protein